MLSKLLPLLAPLLVPALTSVITALGALLISKLQKDARLANLAAVAQAAEDALKAAALADGGQLTKAGLLAAARAAKAQLLSESPLIEKALEAELDTLIHGRLLTLTTAGGATVSLPQQGGK